jgi:hypothetical protein
MQLRPTVGEAGITSAPRNNTIAAGLSIERAELDKVARWIPEKEMALLLEIFERAQCDPDLTRPALLLCLAYAERVARMLDQDPFPTLTIRIRDRLEQLRQRHGL